MNILKTTRRILATFVGLALLLTFLDFTGTLHHWFAWLAQVQFLPAVLAVNVAIVAALLILTLVLGRIYCSVICPLGIMQDAIAWIGRKAKKNRYSYSKEKKWLRWAVLAFTIVCLLANVSIVVSLLAPYSTFGRIVTTLFQPLYILINNVFASLAERIDSYAFYERELWIESFVFIAITAVHLIVIAVLAWRNGRTYCNTICPVGTLLSFVARFSIFKVRLDADKCKSCGKCAKNCKAACIDFKGKQIDYSRCVVCGDCIDQCAFGALDLSPALPSTEGVSKLPADDKSTGKSNFIGLPLSGRLEGAVDNSRRAFLLSSATAAATIALAEEGIKMDGGLARIEKKVAPKRNTKIVPPGAFSAQHLAQHCTACQLCISECPNGVLRPSTDLETFMQPVMSYEHGHCRIECNRCSTVCPTGAIRPIQPEEKTAIQVGHAVWVRDNCIPVTDGQHCGNCARHCPVGAIEMVNLDPDNPQSPRIPAINENACIGCGACEDLCPSRPFSAIYVEGHERQKEI